MSNEIVTWAETRTYITSTLNMDDEWLVDRENGFDWYPADHRHSIDVLDSGLFAEGRPANWLTLRSRIDILDTDETVGLHLAAHYNAQFGLGVFIYENGRLYLQSTFVLSALGKSLLTHFVVQILAQTTRAAQIMAAYQSVGTDGVKLISATHPVSGVRQIPDQLLATYWDGDASGLADERYRGALRFALVESVHKQLLPEWESKFRNAEVSFYNNATISFNLGTAPESSESLEFGVGILMATHLYDKHLFLDARAANELNMLIGNELRCSQFGPFRVPRVLPDGEQSPSQLVAHLPTASLIRHVNSPDNLVNEILNFIYHSVGTCIQLHNMMQDPSGPLSVR